MTDNKTKPLSVLGSLRAEGGRGVVHVEDVYPTDIDDLWSAISQPERLKRWLVEVDGDITVGGKFTARFTSGWEGTGRVDVCDAPRRLLVTTFGEPQETVMEAILTEEESGTRLVVEERGLPLEDTPYHGAGWQVHIEDLGVYLSGRARSPWEDRWRALLPTYQELPFG